MNNEIKEILKDLEFCSGVFDYTITPDRCTFLKYYITNLQEKNKQLKDKIKNNERCRRKMQRTLQQRIDKLKGEPRNINVCGSWLTKSEYDEFIKGEEEKKIPEKLETWYSVLVKQSDEDNVEYANYNFSTMYEKINEIIDYLKSKGE